MSKKKRSIINLTSDTSDDDDDDVLPSKNKKSCIDLTGDDDDERPRDTSLHRQKMAWYLLESKNICSSGNEHVAKSFREVMNAGIAHPSWVVLSNMLFDWGFLSDIWPELVSVDRVCIFQHDTDRPQLPANFEIHGRNPKVHGITHPSGTRIVGDRIWGSHHAKFAILGYEESVRIVITTANFVPMDVLYLSQGVWYQDFPLLENCVSDFGTSLIDYVQALLDHGGGPATRGNWGSHFQGSLTKALSRYDYTGATAYLVPVVPGYHQGEALHRYGQMRVRSILSKYQKHNDGNIIMQFSSMASTNPSYIKQLTKTFGGDPKKDRLNIVWPTREDILNSTQGPLAGSHLPARKDNVDKLHQGGYLYKWKDKTASRNSPLLQARERAVPHMKSMTRILSDRVAWSIITSSNISKSSWGDIQKSETQLYCQNWELGILVTPDTLKCDRLLTKQQSDNSPLTYDNQSTAIVPLPFPTSPLVPYAPDDNPWVSF